MSQISEDQKLAATLAGQIHSGLAGTVGNTKINPKEVLSKMGIDVNEANRRFGPQQRTVPVSNVKIPGMIEAPRNTPQGSEIAGVSTVMPELIPIPDDLKQFAEEYIKETTQQPQPAPMPEPPPQDPGILVITEPAPVPIESVNLLDKIFERLDNIEKMLSSNVKTKTKNSNYRNNYKKKNNKKVLLNENNFEKHSEKQYSKGDSPAT